MKKLLIVILAALPFVAYAQMPGMPGGMQMPGMQDLPEETIVAETQSMVSQFALNEDQAAKLLDLNKKYLGKVSYPVILPPEAEEAMKNAAANRPAGGAGAAGGFSMGNMSQEDRDQMMSMMNQMQERMAEIEDNQTAYEEGLASILDKKQMKKWRKAKKHYQREQELQMERQFGGMGGFGGGFPGGGMPGGGGGFGGGMPGGGFPGGGGFGF
jgi:hypothetical protein